jgi:aryl-alcohol dehydrogenase-like predicted oxidoreductase
VQSQWTAERRGREYVSTEQPPYSIFARRIERDLLPVCLSYRMGVIVWSPLNQGWLTGKYRRDHSGATQRAELWPELFDPADPGNAAKYDALEALDQLAERLDISLTHLALAWTLEHPAVTSAIIGPRTMEQLEGLVGADEHRVPSDVLDEIDKLVAPGTNLRTADGAFDPPWLKDAAQRRRGPA